MKLNFGDVNRCMFLLILQNEQHKRNEDLNEKRKTEDGDERLLKKNFKK